MTLRAAEIDCLASRMLAYTGVHWLGVFAHDQVPKLDRSQHRPFALVVNTDPSDKPGKHWLAFFAAMSLVQLTSVQQIMNANATGLAILMLLALGTFTAGVHILAWQICLVGIVMAVGVPAIAWMEQSALLLWAGTLLLLAIGLACWWFLGRPAVKTVYSQIGTYVHGQRTRGEDTSLCILEFEDGAVGLVEDSWARRGGMDDCIEVYGEGGVTYADLHMGNALPTFSEYGFGYAVEKAPSTKGWTTTSASKARPSSFRPANRSTFAPANPSSR